MRVIKVKVKRAQCYATIMGNNSFFYEYDPEPIRLLSEEYIWEYTKCRFPDAKEKYISYICTGKTPDFSKEVEFICRWLEQHGSKISPDWQGAINNYIKDLAFLLSGYKETAKMFEPVKVVYTIETLNPYALGKVGTRENEMLMPYSDEKIFTHEKEGFLKTL